MSKFKKGDWICPKCEDHQFSKNSVCRRCGEKKPTDVENIKSGDWFCSSCNAHQFAFRSACRDCGTLKGGVVEPTIQTTKGIQSKEFYLVLDFEANCSEQDKRDHEIIEFPAVLVKAIDGQTVSEFQSFVKLVKTEKLSKFIKELTHITDEQVSSGLSWSDCLLEFEKWCNKNKVTPENTTVVTCGDWDLKTMLPNQLAITKTELSDYLNYLFCCWCNAKIQFANCYKQAELNGMDRMLDFLGLELTGHHHSGIDDCRNIAKICKRLMEDGTDVTSPTKIREQTFWYPGHKLAYRRSKTGKIMRSQ